MKEILSTNSEIRDNQDKINETLILNGDEVSNITTQYNLTKMFGLNN